MTLREHILKRPRWISLVQLLVLLLLLLVVASLFIGRFSVGGLLVVFALFAILVASLVIPILIPKCPKRDGRLHILVQSLKRSKLLRKRIDFCPYCGVSFDDEMDTQEE